jgi:hypothetical protein
VARRIVTTGSTMTEAGGGWTATANPLGRAARAKENKTTNTPTLNLIDAIIPGRGTGVDHAGKQDGAAGGPFPAWHRGLSAAHAALTLHLW